MELLPDALVRPFLEVLVGLALQVQAHDLGRAQAAQREPARVVDVDELVRRRRGAGEDPEPAEGVGAVVLGQLAGRDRGAADAVEAVAAGDDVALEGLLLARVGERDRRAVGLQAVDRDVLDLEADVAAVAFADGDQVLDDLLLAVDRDRPPAGQRAQVDAVALAVEAQLDPVVDEPLAVQPVAQAGVGQQLDRALLEHPGAHPLLHVLAAARLEHDRPDPLEVEEVRQEQAGRPGPDDSDLCPHLSEALSYPVRERSIPNGAASMRDEYPPGRPRALAVMRWCAEGRLRVSRRRTGRRPQGRTSPPPRAA